MSMNRKTMTICAAVAAGLLLVAFTVFAVTGRSGESVEVGIDSGGLHKAILTVSGMSCGGCEATIREGLASIQGIAEVRVDVSGGRAEVLYDSRVVTDVDRIAAAITASGYPARVERVVGAEQLENERNRAVELAGEYIASVDDRLILRTDYLMELNHAKSRYTEFYGDDVFADERGRQTLESLKVQTGQRLVDEAIQLKAIQRAGFELDQAALQQALSAFLKKRGLSVKEFTAELKNAGYSFEYFGKRFNNQTLIREYQEKVLFSGTTNDAEKRQRYLKWFSDSRRQAEVVFFDRELADLSRRGGGSCGGCSAG